MPFEKKLNSLFNFDPLPPILTLTPPWKYSKPNIRLDMTLIPKTLNPYPFFAALQDIISEFPDHIHCYTDGSRSRDRTACAYSVALSIHSHRLRNSFSVFSAELTAIHLCIQSLSKSPPNSKFIVFTDSLSSLNAFQNPYSTHPLTQRILLTLHSLSSADIHIVFVWIPAHIGIKGNESVDRAAKLATKFPKITFPSKATSSDLALYYRGHIYKQWHYLWHNQQNNKLRQIKKAPIPWSSSFRKSRHEESVITRLRIGHSLITHAHLLNNLFPLSCPKCQSDKFSIDHLFSCPLLSTLRNHYSIPPNRPSALQNNPSSIDNVISFLKHANLFQYI